MTAHKRSAEPLLQTLHRFNKAATFHPVHLFASDSYFSTLPATGHGWVLKTAAAARRILYGRINNGWHDGGRAPPPLKILPIVSTLMCKNNARNHKRRMFSVSAECGEPSPVLPCFPPPCVFLARRSPMELSRGGMEKSGLAFLTCVSHASCPSVRRTLASSGLYGVLLSVLLLPGFAFSPHVFISLLLPALFHTLPLILSFFFFFKCLFLGFARALSVSVSLPPCDVLFPFFCSSFLFPNLLLCPFSSVSSFIPA